ncbi:MAG: BamA/TamA family outer membrane protein [Phaeodactylibacter sp.]|uniref:BamA/TamA family outer membrane protein n=1 Tax=Phaeodactylibacter sp. TaxID=1940289 RepID=UPI0032EDCEBF
MKTTLFLLLCFGAGLLYGQDSKDSLQQSSSRIVALPIVFLTPETSWGFGAAGIYTFRLPGESPESRPSQLQLGGAYTLENQVLAYLPFQVFAKAGQYNVYGELGYYRYTYFYYGIGNQYEDYDGELFDLAFPRVRLNAARRTFGQWYVGFRFWLDDMDVSGLEPGGLLEAEGATGQSGGLLTAAGGFLLLDQRDNVFYPTAGHYLELGAVRSGSFVGSQFDFTKYALDARKYWSAGTGAVVALNAYLEANTGDPPFTHLALMGGTRRMRGFYEGRYRDRQMAILQASYRFPLFWRLKGAVFGGLGNVARQISGFRAQNTRWTAGLGLRFLLLEAEQVHVRLDYGFGEGTSGFYLTVGEAF